MWISFAHSMDKVDLALGPTVPSQQVSVYKEVAIGDDVWIGAGAIILPGVKVGDHAVIGAGALVREDVSAWAIVGGLPAKVLGDRRPKLHSIDRKLNA